MIKHEQEIQNSIQTSRNLADLLDAAELRLTTAEHKVVLLEHAFKELMQAYHCLASINKADRHSSLNYTDCDEQTCKESVRLLNLIMSSSNVK